MMKKTKDTDAVLLVLDDESTVCRALSRLLSRRVREVLTAGSPAEAEAILKTGVVTHLICDHWLGPGSPLGVDLAAAWRKKYPSIKRTVILTGTDTTRLDPHPGIDAITDKTVDPEALVEALALDLH